MKKIFAFIHDYIFPNNPKIKRNKISNEPIELHLTDFSGYNQPYHPSVIYIDGGFAGYDYWMVQTPFPIDAEPYRDRWESPVVYKSHDGIEWLPVANPLDDLTEEEIAILDYMSDAHILYREDTKTLEVWYRLTNREMVKAEGNLFIKIIRKLLNRQYRQIIWTTILRKTTTNGKEWSEREIMIPKKKEILDDDVMRSPAFIWDNITSEYRVWYQSNTGLFYTTSVNGKDWEPRKELTFDIPHTTWHLDVNFFNDIYHLLSYSIEEQNIVYYTSSNGINYHYERDLLAMDDGYPLYSRGLYRAVSLKDRDEKIRVYFTVETVDNETRIGLLIGDSFKHF